MPEAKATISEIELEKLSRLARLMDSQYSVPGTSIRFGLDSIFGLIPGLGDTGTFFVTLYLIEKSKQFNVPETVRKQMLMNMLVDWLIGAVPLAGDLFDIGWKANERNVSLIRQHVNTLLD
jgi:hypothetical protein